VIFDEMSCSSYLAITYGAIGHILKVVRLILETIICYVDELTNNNVLMQSTKASYSDGDPIEVQ